MWRRLLVALAAAQPDGPWPALKANLPEASPCAADFEVDWPSVRGGSSADGAVGLASDGRVSSKRTPPPLTGDSQSADGRGLFAW